MVANFATFITEEITDGVKLARGRLAGVLYLVDLDVMISVMVLASVAKMDCLNARWHVKVITANVLLF